MTLSSGNASFASLAPNLAIVTRSCLVLAGFGAGFLALARGLLRLE